VIASASADSTLKLWDAASGRVVHTLDHTIYDVTACAFSPDGNTIVTANSRGLEFWEVATGRKLRYVSGHIDDVNGCAYSPDGSQAASASRDTTLRIWNAASGQLLHNLKGLNFATACAFSPDGCFIICAYENRTVRVWDAASGQSVRTLQGHTDTVRSCAYSPDGRLIASSGADRTVRVWDATNGQLLHTLEGLSSGGRVCAFSPDGSFLLSAMKENSLQFWDPQDGELKACLALPSAPVCLGLHPWAPRLAYGDRIGAVYIFDRIGVDYGPVIVTAVETGYGIEIHCPACQQRFLIKSGSLGGGFTCPKPDCRTRMKINRFVLPKPVRSIVEGPVGPVVPPHAQRKTNWFSNLKKK
jgi:WD40 repeat protein